VPRRQIGATVSRPQTWIEIEKSRIEKAGGTIIEGRVNGGLNLTRAIGNISRNLGDFDYKINKNLDYKQQIVTCHPDVKKIPRSP
jgi:hypothetical protein